MPILTPHPQLAPLLRMMQLPPSLMRYAPQSVDKPMRTLLLRDTALAKDLRASFDDTCRVTVPDDDSDCLAHVKLQVPGGAREVTGLQLTILSPHSHLQLTAGGDHIRLFVGVGAVLRAHIQLAGQATLFIGDGCTLAATRVIAANADVVLGDDCQVLDDVVLQCSDPHPITDLDRGEVINAQRRQVHLGRHVLVGRRSLILPDVRVGHGAIIDPGSVVSQDVAAQSQVGGAPAVVVRPRAAWARQFGKAPPDLGS